MALVTEPLDSRARERLFTLVEDFKGGDPLAPVTVIVPSTYAGLDLRHDLGRLGSTNVYIIGLSRLAELLGAPSLAAQGRRPLTPLVEAAAVRAVASEAGGPLEPVRQHPALNRTLQSTFRELRHAAEAGLTALAAQGRLRAEVVRLYRLFREHTDPKYYDREALAQAAARSVRDNTATGLKDLGPVVFYLVSGLTPGEQALVEALDEQWSCAVVLGLAGDPSGDGPVRALGDRLGRVLGPTQEGAEPRLPPVSGLVIAPDPHQEVHWVLRRLMKAAEEGTPFHRMAILYRQSNPYAALVQEELRLSGVAMAGPGNVNLIDTAAGRTLLGLMRLVGRDLPRSELMAWLTSCPIAAPGEPRPAIQPSHWDAISRKAGVVGGLDQWEQRLDRYAGDMERLAEEGLRSGDMPDARTARLEGEAAATRSLLSFVTGLAGRLEAPPDGSGWPALAGWAQNLLTSYLDRSTANLRDAEEAALTRVEETLREMRTLDDVEAGPSFDGFFLALEGALASPIGHLGQTGRGVFVAPLNTALGMRFDLVCVVGMVEGAMPPRQPDDPLLPDRERQRAGGPSAGLPLRGGREADERYAYLAALAAGDQCVLSFPQGNPGSQRGQFPSRWFLEAATQLHGAPVYTSNLRAIGPVPWLTTVASMEDGLRTVATESAADIHDRDVEGLWRWRRAGMPMEQHHLAASGQLSRALNLEQGREARQLTHWDGDVSILKGRTRRLRLLDRPALSPTSLETWATCPFRYLMSNVLGVAALEQPEDVATMSPLEKGSLVHGVLESFIRGGQKERSLPTPEEPWSEEHRNRLRHLALESFADAEERGVTGKALLWELQQEAILSDLDEFLSADAGLRERFGVTPHLVEVRFGLPGSSGGEPGLEAAQRDIPGVGILRFRGVADRVDLDPSGKLALVLDYKTGSTSSYRSMKDDPVAGGKRLQLPIYTIALQNSLGTDVTVRAAYWFVSASGRFEIIPPEPVEMAEVAKRFDSVVGTIAQGIAEGLFPANPGTEDRNGFSNCNYCDFNTLCPSRRDIHWERKQADSRLQAYLQMQSGEADKAEGEC